jgi:glycosyltransferase involved in cell wall biosynthesis
MRVTFVNRYFYPDHSATSQMLTDLAFHLASRGWEVRVITSRQRYDDARAALPKRERVNGVDVHRIRTSRFGRSSLPGRALDYLTFYFSSYFALLGSRDGLVVALTDPPLLSVVARLAAPRVVNWVQDLFPEVAQRLGVRVPGVGLLRRVRNWSLRRARANVALGDRMAAQIALPNVVVQHNWAGADLRPLPKTDPAFVLGYSGNLGRAHEFATMLAAARALPDVRLVITGAGAKLAELQASAPANTTFQPYAPRERLSERLSSADVHLVTLQPSLEGLIVPSKFYGILAVARPVIFVGDADGEVARIIREHDLGFSVAPGDVDALVGAVRALAADRARAAAMGARGRALYEQRFAPEIAFANWEGILRECSVLSA